MDMLISQPELQELKELQVKVGETCDFNENVSSCLFSPIDKFVFYRPTEKIDKDIQSLNDIEEGHIVRGYVKSVTDVGVFVR
jgi:ribosomal protein S1